MKKTKQINANSSRGADRRQPISDRCESVTPAVRNVPLFTMAELRDMREDPATVVAAMRITQPDPGEFVVVQLTSAQSKLFNAREAWPKLSTFLPIATDPQLRCMRRSVVLTVSQREHGAMRGRFEFIGLSVLAIDKLKEHGVTAHEAGRRIQQIEAEVEKRERMRKLQHILKNGTPAQIATLRRGLNFIAGSIADRCKRS